MGSKSKCRVFLYICIKKKNHTVAFILNRRNEMEFKERPKWFHSLATVESVNGAVGNIVQQIKKILPTIITKYYDINLKILFCTRIFVRIIYFIKNANN